MDHPLEPKMMQMFLALVDANGAVVSREQLVEQCWGQRFVADDAINRVVAGLRRAGRETGDAFEIETIAKIGYRLKLDRAIVPVAPDAETPAAEAGIDRRRLILGGAAMAAAGTLLVWRPWATRGVAEADALIARATERVRSDTVYGSREALPFLHRATRIAPDYPRAWGKLALAQAYIANSSDPKDLDDAIAKAQIAARRALSLDPAQGDALVALALLIPIFGNWFQVETRLRETLADVPDHPAAMGRLAMLLASTGRHRDANQLTTRLLAMEPLLPGDNAHQIYSLWNIGRIREMDALADRAMQAFPSHRQIVPARMRTFGFTGRHAEALALLQGPNPSILAPPLVAEAWIATFSALAAPSPERRGEAVQQALAAAGKRQSSGRFALEMLAVLNAVDEAFTVAEGFLLRRGPIVPPLVPVDGKPSVIGLRSRDTTMLFTPPTAPMRADPRFWPLVREIGLVGYWQASGTKPDFLGGAPLPV